MVYVPRSKSKVQNPDRFNGQRFAAQYQTTGSYITRQSRNVWVVVYTHLSPLCKNSMVVLTTVTDYMAERYINRREWHLSRVTE